LPYQYVSQSSTAMQPLSESNSSIEEIHLAEMDSPIHDVKKCYVKTVRGHPQKTFAQNRKKIDPLVCKMSALAQPACPCGHTINFEKAEVFAPKMPCSVPPLLFHRCLNVD